MFRYLTAGESHGPALIGLLDGIPSHLELDIAAIDDTLARRQGGYGRGARMAIERDQVEFLAGVRGSRTLGSPIAAVVRNRDYANPAVRALMDPISGSGKPLTNPRPGHADFAGALKYRQRDLRDVLERASARETAMRVCLGAICAQFLGALGVVTRSYVHQIGSVESTAFDDWEQADVESSDVRNPDPHISQRMTGAIDAAKAAGDTLGGSFIVRVDGLPVGIGSNRQPNQRLDGIVAGALMGMQTVKAVEIGLGAGVAGKPGSQAHDAFGLGPDGILRGSNRAGGIEGGMSNGQPVVVRVSIKPIPTLMKALPSVNLHARTDAPATVVRSDVCVVPAAAIVGEAMVRLALMAPVLEKYGGDSMEETLDNLRRSGDAAASLFERAEAENV
jgi:chorismate synthase